MAVDESERTRRFSQLHLEHGAPTRDSERMRVRLFAIMQSLYFDEEVQGLVAHLASRKLGISVPISSGRHDWQAFFADQPIRDLLDTITLLYIAMTWRGLEHKVSPFLSEVNVVFVEENVGYHADA